MSMPVEWCDPHLIHHPIGSQCVVQCASSSSQFHDRPNGWKNDTASRFVRNLEMTKENQYARFNNPLWTTPWGLHRQNSRFKDCRTCGEMLIVFFDYSEAVNHEYVPETQIRRRTILTFSVVDAFRSKRPHLWDFQNQHIHHDNIPVQSSQLIESFRAKNIILVIRHALYMDRLLISSVFFPKSNRHSKIPAALSKNTLFRRGR